MPEPAKPATYLLTRTSLKVAAAGAELRLAISPGGTVSRILELTGIGERLPVYPSAELAAGNSGQLLS